MSEILDAQCSVAALRVFETPELLELILLQVAEWEVDLESQCTSKTTDPRTYGPAHRSFCYLPEPRYAFSPIVLRRVNRTFKDTIDCSPKLRKLSLKALPRQLAPRRLHPLLSYEHFGPLHWLESKAGLEFIWNSKVENGVLHVCATIVGRSEHERYKLRKDLTGSWRKLPCILHPKAASKVVLQLVTSARYRPVGRRPGRLFTYFEYDLRTCDLGPNPKLGLLFDIIDAAEVSMDIEDKNF
ncbi:hypothetical protein CKM354_001035800 [Cercospora kikuchii]|uniref:Uncharacterized protein n=1 Tax=Cercospora kikuchii TaxID=84275 RepID=A0A9P3CR74_9PEZI|nr:uncharacterized protein CKM354_001035800 [Cercospora kikuchii]GIZ47261.1 hypothetical protein CKM354_001035800 [Cercospora kikuchii]